MVAGAMQWRGALLCCRAGGAGGGGGRRPGGRRKNDERQEEEERCRALPLSCDRHGMKHSSLMHSFIFVVS
jgi:hypothetical protein